MSLFQRAIRLVLWIIGLVVALVVALATLFARRIVRPPRLPLWVEPEDLGIAYENVNFPAREDGVRLSGWFLPARDGNGATVVMVHGWPWNRLGEVSEGLVANLIGTASVDLLRMGHALHHAGYNVLMYDARNHGQSAAQGTMTFGYQEANDLLGALDYLATRPDVDPERVGAVGFSMGANTILYALPRRQGIKAAVAVQPTSPAYFARRFAADIAGPVGMLALPLTELLVKRLGGMRFAAVDPLFVAPSAGETPLLFIQGQGDRWGSPENVAQLAAAAPGTVDTLLVQSTDRFGGYNYVIDHPELVTSFFGDYLK